MKKLLLVLLLLLAIFSLGTIAIAGTNTVTLAWDVVCDTSVTGYNVYFGFAVPPSTTNMVGAHIDTCGVAVPAMTNIYYSYTSRVSVTGRTNNTATIGGLEQGFRYSFVATAINSAGLESDYSNSAEYLVPTNAPPSVWTNVPTAVQNFRIMQAK